MIRDNFLERFAERTGMTDVHMHACPQCGGDTECSDASCTDPYKTPCPECLGQAEKQTILWPRMDTQDDVFPGSRNVPSPWEAERQRKGMRRLAYDVKCTECRKKIRETNDERESYAGDTCEECRRHHDQNHDLRWDKPAAQQIDWNQMQERAKGMSDDQLRYAIKDCLNAGQAMGRESRSGKDQGYYADEASIYAQELRRRGSSYGIEIAHKCASFPGFGQDWINRPSMTMEPSRTVPGAWDVLKDDQVVVEGESYGVASQIIESGGLEYSEGDEVRDSLAMRKRALSADFERDVHMIAEWAGVSSEDVMAKWKQYVKNCEGYDQSPVMSEFVYGNYEGFNIEELSAYTKANLMRPSLVGQRARLAESFNPWFLRFLEEKQLPHEEWELTGSDGTPHYIDSDVVIEAIQNAPPNEQVGIKDTIVKIDFRNGDVNDYFKHLAQVLVKGYGESGF